MIKVIRDTCNKLKLVVEGELKIDQTKIDPYDTYVKKEEQKQIEDQILKHLSTIVPNPYDGYSTVYGFSEACGYSRALSSLATYLAKGA